MSDTSGAPAPTETPATATNTPAVEGGTPSTIINADGTPIIKEEPKVEEAKTEEKPTEVVPLKAEDIKLPEGFQASEEVMGKLVETINNPDLSPQARAEALIAIHTAEIQKAREGVSTDWNNTVEKWIKEVADDRELGSGDSKKPLKPEVSAAIAKVIDQAGGTKLREALDLTGAGNNPEIIRAFAKISKVLAEGSFVKGEPSTSKTQGPGASALYPDLPSE